MNLVPLVAALLPWARSPFDALLRIVAAVSVLSVEMQVAALSGFGSLRTLAPINLALAVGAAGWQLSRCRPDAAWLRAVWEAAPWPMMALIGTVVLGLNLSLPFEGADPYNLLRIDAIQRTGTLAYDPAADPKVNIVSSVYELVLADAGLVPVAGPTLMRLHGVAGLLFYLLGVAVVRGWLPAAGPRWMWAALLAIPVVFHQFVLVKNDLFLAVPAFAGLAWLIARGPTAGPRDIVGMSWLIGFASAAKPTNLPLAVALAAVLLASRRRTMLQTAGAIALGGLAAAMAGGTFFTLIENARHYGDPFARGPVAEMGNVTATAGEALVSLGRFGISLVDLGQVTRRLWPGRGGWGGTFGLPFIWALCVLAVCAPRSREARWTLAVMAAHFVAFAGTFPDADVAHRLALAPGLLAVAVGVWLASTDEGAARARLALVPVIGLSSVQILRSAVLYLHR